MSRNSITPSRAFLTISDRVLIAGGAPSRPGRRSSTPIAHEATGFGPPTTSTRHIRQLPAIDMPLVVTKPRNFGACLFAGLQQRNAVHRPRPLAPSTIMTFDHSAPRLLLLAAPARRFTIRSSLALPCARPPPAPYCKNPPMFLHVLAQTVQRPSVMSSCLPSRHHPAGLTPPLIRPQPVAVTSGIDRSSPLSPVGNSGSNP